MFTRKNSFSTERRIHKKLLIFVGLAIVLFLVVYFATQRSGQAISVKNSNLPSPSTPPASTLAGLPCENGHNRPMAIMMPSDPEARPLSGISLADMVFEMPVTDGGVTRMMAVFQCNQPAEIGPIRSSRLDFIPLVQGLNAIYAHFGGEHDALEKLNAGIVDNIDGLKYDGTVYYRAATRPRPHNAYTSYKALLAKASELSYRPDLTLVDYEHTPTMASNELTSPPILYADQFAVNWLYDKTTNVYLRNRDSRIELDKLTKKQVVANNVIIMRTTWSPINKDYIRVTTVGSGSVSIYRDGKVINGTWEKKSTTAALRFYDSDHKTIPLAPGLTWVEIVI